MRSRITLLFQLPNVLDCVLFIYAVDLRMHPDMDYDRPQKSYIIPEPIKTFLLYFQKSISDQNLYEIQNSYENG